MLLSAFCSRHLDLLFLKMVPFHQQQHQHEQLQTIGSFVSELLIHSACASNPSIADDISIVPYNAETHPMMAHTFITLDGEMVRNAQFAEELKDTCTKVLHMHLNSEVTGRKLGTTSQIRRAILESNSRR